MDFLLDFPTFPRGYEIHMKHSMPQCKPIHVQNKGNISRTAKTKLMKLESYKTTVIYLQPFDWFISVTEIFSQFMVTSFTLELTPFLKFYLKGHPNKDRTENPHLIHTVSLYTEDGLGFILNVRLSHVLRRYKYLF